jgi:hypothetical protein
MKLHNTTIEQLVNICDLWGGHKENKKLKQALSTLKFDVRLDENSQKVILLVK